MPRSLVHYSSARVILVSIMVTLLIGTCLLKIPWCHSESISWVDSLFTATSCLCICGLSTTPFTSFTLLGQCVLLFLIQIGGLGLITLTFFLMSFFVQFGFTTQVMAGQLLELESWKDIKKIIFFIIGFTICIELLAACITFYFIYNNYTIPRAIFLSLFHAISTFCDSGISLFPEGMITYKTHYCMLLFNSFLMIIAGLGFITWYEIFKYLRSIYYRKRFHMTLQTKVVLTVTCFLIVISSLFYWLLERHNTFGAFSSFESLIQAFFNGAAIRGTGLSTVHIDQLQLATLLLIMVISFIGSAPGSTGSGIKVTTFAVFLAAIKAALDGKTAVSIMGRSIAKDQVFKAIAIPILALSWIILTTFLLLITEQGSFLDLLFESVSAFATLGLSMGVTPSLTVFGKLMIIASMVVGRIGAFTFIIALYKKHEMPEFSYPEERLILG